MSSRVELLAPYVDRASICSYATIDEMMAAYPVYAAGKEWLDGFIMKAHPELMRPGHVCPFVIQSAKKDALTFACMEAPDHTAQGCFEAVMPLREIFFKLEPTEGPGRLLRSLILFFPNLPPEAAADFIDGGHKLLKPHFVEAGLMVGEFHPTSEVEGSTNPAFRPMRSPVPAIVIREMSVHDIRFLAVPGESAERQVRYVNAYLKHMQGRATTEMLARAQATLERLEEVSPAE